MYKKGGYLSIVLDKNQVFCLLCSLKGDKYYARERLSVEMKKEKTDKNFIHRPEYPGGPKALQQFIRQNLKYPPEALKNKIEGAVYVTYDIDYKGNVVEAKILSSLGHGCDEEAIRLVKELKFHVAKHRGLRVLFHQKIHIHFRLPKQKPASPRAVSYELVSKPASEPPKEGKKPGETYTITITY